MKVDNPKFNHKNPAGTVVCSDCPFADGHVTPIFKNGNINRVRGQNRFGCVSSAKWNFRITNTMHLCKLSQTAIKSHHHMSSGPDAAKTIRETFGLEI